MRQFTISLILLLIATTVQFANSENEPNSEELNTDDYDDDSDDLEDSPDDQDFHFEDKKPFYKQKNHVKDRVKEIYLSWDLDLCKDVQCKPNQVCLIQKSRKSAICVLRKSINRKKAQSKKDAKWSNNSKKLTHKVSASINKSNNQVKSWDSSYLPSSFPSTLSSSSVAPFDKTKPWKDCRPCPVTKPAFYCGTDNSTYSSMCRLQFHNCVHETDVEVACKGFCPCGSPVNVHTRTKEVRNHERWNKYMDTLSKLRRSHKVEKFVKNRAKVALEYTGLYHDGVDGKKSLKKQIAICTKEELKTMGDRLSDWFAVVLRDQKRSQLNKKETFLDYITSPDCPKDIANMFHRLDTDEDLRLSLKELYDLEHDKREKCLKQYLDGCDEDRDTFLNPYEWCSCFDRKSKPCLIEKSQRKKVYDEFVPKCDKDGFYQPIQCHLHKCWCVDRYGIEIENTRQTEIPDCDHKSIAKRKEEKRNIYSPDNARITDDDLDDSDDSGDSDDSFDGSGDDP